MEQLLRQVVSSYLEVVRQGIELDKVDETHIISLPFLSSDGHLIEVAIRQLHTGYIHLSDMRNEISELELAGVEMGPRSKKIAQDLAAQYGLEFKEGEISTVAELDKIGEVLHSMVQALIRISDLRFLHEGARAKKPRVKEKTRDLFESQKIRYRAAGQARLKGRYNVEYQFDFIVPNRHRMTVVKAIEAEVGLEKTVEACAYEFDAVTGSNNTLKKMGIYDPGNKWNERLQKIAQGSVDVFVPIEEEERIVAEVK